MLKRLFFWFCSVLIVFLVIFTIGEIAFRIFRGKHNPLINLTQKKNTYLFDPNKIIHNTSSVVGEFDHMAVINSYGYRGKDFSVPKENGKIRIFAVGDSFTFGVGAEDSETIPHLIQEKLHNQGLENVEVINAGIGHASTISNYINLRDIHLKYQPDMVVYLFDLTDLWDDWHSERNAVYNKDGEIAYFSPVFINGKRDWWVTAVYYSAFCRWINDKIVRSIKKIQLIGFKRYIKLAMEGKKAKAEIAKAQSMSEEAQLEYDGLLMMRGEVKKALIDKQWIRTEKYLRKIKELLDQHNIPMVIVMYPHGIYVGADEWNEGRKHWGFEQGKLYTDRYPFKLVEYFARDQRVVFINTLDNLLEVKYSQGVDGKVSSKKLFFDHDGHMKPEGNKIVANAIVNNAEFKDVVANLAVEKNVIAIEDAPAL